MYLTYYEHLVRIKKKKLIVRKHGVELFAINVKSGFVRHRIKFSGGLCKSGKGFRKQLEID